MDCIINIDGVEFKGVINDRGYVEAIIILDGENNLLHPHYLGCGNLCDEVMNMEYITNDMLAKYFKKLGFNIYNIAGLYRLIYRKISILIARDGYIEVGDE